MHHQTHKRSSGLNLPVAVPKPARAKRNIFSAGYSRFIIGAAVPVLAIAMANASCNREGNLSDQNQAISWQSQNENKIAELRVQHPTLASNLVAFHLDFLLERLSAIPGIDSLVKGDAGLAMLAEVKLYQNGYFFTIPGRSSTDTIGYREDGKEKPAALLSDLAYDMFSSFSVIRDNFNARFAALSNGRELSGNSRAVLIAAARSFVYAMKCGNIQYAENANLYSQLASHKRLNCSSASHIFIQLGMEKGLALLAIDLFTNMGAHLVVAHGGKNGIYEIVESTLALQPPYTSRIIYDDFRHYRASDNLTYYNYSGNSISVNGIDALPSALSLYIHHYELDR